MNLPKHYQQVMPYLILKKIPEFMEFAKHVFDAKVLSVHKDMKGRVVHGEITIGNATIMMGESGGNWEVQNAGLFIYVENADETYAKALEHGATEVTPLEDQEYGRSGGVKDPFGNVWWITGVNSD